MGLLDLVFPKSCLGCGRAGQYICADCVAKVRQARAICPYCEKPSIDGVTHARCAKKLGLDGFTSIWEYEEVVRKAILALKYKYVTQIVEELLVYLIPLLKRRVLPGAQLLVPVPIYWYRQNMRGFNQSEELGGKVAKALGTKFIPNLLIKKKSTISQTELSGDARRKNLYGAFSLNPRFEIPGSVLLFDDVFTTGSTLKEAAKILKRAGVKKAWGLTIAR